MNAQFKTWMTWTLAAAGAVLIFAAWLTPEGALSFATLTSFCGQGDVQARFVKQYRANHQWVLVRFAREIRRFCVVLL